MSLYSLEENGHYM